MPTALELAAENALRACAEAEVGVIIRVELSGARDVIAPALRAKQVLYRFRRELGDPTFRNIQIRLSPDNPDTELWLIKTSDDQTADAVDNAASEIVSDL